MTWADDIKPLLSSVRAIPGGVLGIRPHTVSLIVKSYTGAQTGEGEEIVIETPITEAGGQPPRVRWLRADELAVGGLAAGTIEVGPITPSHSAGGTDIALIDGSAEAVGETRFLRITGPSHPSGADYMITDIKSDRALHYKIQAKPVTSAE